MRDIDTEKRLYREPARGKVSGVCAGLARYWQIQPWLIRLAAVVCFFMLPLPTAVAYLMAVILLRAN